MTEFKTSLGSSAKIATIVIVVLFACAISSLFIFDDDDAIPVAIVIPVVLLFILGLSYYFSIKGYVVTDDEVVIKRPFDNVTFKKGNFKNAERVDKKALGFVIRTFGIGGLFSYTGEFWSKRVGHMTWYVTRTDAAVMLTTSSNRKIVVSPDEPEKFIAALKERID